MRSVLLLFLGVFLALSAGVAFAEQSNESYSWVSVPDNQIPVVIQISGTVDQSLADTVVEQLNSEDHFMVYGQKYYHGWNKVIDDIADIIGINSPKLKIEDSVKNSQAIIITLSDKKSSDGYSGYTKLYLRDSKIEGATITIYDTDTLSKQALDAIVRHELGHALGLGHAKTEDALMNHDGVKNGMISMIDVVALMMALLDDR